MNKVVRATICIDPKNDIGFVRFKAQTIQFVERGLERLGLGHRTAVSHGFYGNLHEGGPGVSSRVLFRCDLSGSSP